MSARPLTEQEYLSLLAHYRAKRMTRNAALLVVGCGTGYRITELLSLTVGQLWTGTEVAREITIARRQMKGGAGAYKRAVRSRRMPLSEPVRAAILEHLQAIGTDQPESAFSEPRGAKPAAWIERKRTAFWCLVASPAASPPSAFPRTSSAKLLPIELLPDQVPDPPPKAVRPPLARDNSALLGK